MFVLSPFPTLFPIHTCTHTLYYPLLGTNENGHIVNNIKRSPTLAIFSAYTSVSCFVRPIGFSDKAGRFPITPLLSLQSSQRAVSCTLLHLSPSESRAHMCNIAAFHWLLILNFMANVCCMYRKQCTYAFVTFYSLKKPFGIS